jgi:adenylate cyclase
VKFDETWLKSVEATASPGGQPMGATGSGATYRFDRFVLDPSRAVLLSAEGEAIVLRPKAFSVLHLLVENPRRLLDRDTIMRTVWPGVIISDDGITQCVRDIRRALADEAHRIVRTVPRRGYILATDVTMVRDQSDTVMHIAGSVDKPSIAVLPFTNLSGDPEQEFFSDGIADDIITELSRSQSLFVIARNSSFTYRGRPVDVRWVGRELGVRYLIEGSVRREAGRVRTNAQLIDAETGSHIWAERYDRPLQDVFAVQDEITLAVVTAVRPAITDAEYRRVLRKPPSSLDAWEAYQRGLWHVARASPTDDVQAREFFERAVATDALFAPAYAAMARLFDAEGARWGTLSPTEARGLATEWAQRAVAIDPSDSDARATLARILSGSDRRESREHASLALASNPNSPWANCVAGTNLVHDGRAAEGHNLIMTAMRLDPRSPYQVDFMAVLVLAYYFERDYDGAADTARRALARYPMDPRAYLFLAATLGQLCRIQEACEVLRQATKFSPGSFDTYVRSRPTWWRPEDHEHMLDGLRKAGWRG